MRSAAIPQIRHALKRGVEFFLVSDPRGLFVYEFSATVFLIFRDNARELFCDILRNGGDVEVGREVIETVWLAVDGKGESQSTGVIGYGREMLSV